MTLSDKSMTLFDAWCAFGEAAKDILSFCGGKQGMNLILSNCQSNNADPEKITAFDLAEAAEKLVVLVRGWAEVAEFLPDYDLYIDVYDNHCAWPKHRHDGDQPEVCLRIDERIDDQDQLLIGWGDGYHRTFDEGSFSLAIQDLDRLQEYMEAFAKNEPQPD